MTEETKSFSIRTAKIKGQEYNFLWPAEDRGCFNIISRDWKNMYDVIMANTSDRDTVVQAGGNCGLYPFMLAFEFNRVFTFEPDPINFFCLTKNCRTNKIIKFNTALGDKNKFLSIGNKTPKNTGMNKIGDGHLGIFSITLDSLKLDSLSLLFLDIEGYEYYALRGAISTIKKCRPTIVFELSPGERDFIFNLLYKLNYKEVKNFNSNSQNFIFIPEERA